MITKVFLFSQKGYILLFYVKVKVAFQRKEDHIVFMPKMNVYKSGVGAKNKTWYKC